MDYDAIGAVLFIAALVTSIFLALRRKARPLVYITDYQCGLRYVNGAFVDVVGPGNYRVDGTNKQITIMDLRPRLIVVERIFYQDAIQSHSVISIGAELSVSDAYLAATKLKDQTVDSIAIVRDALRSTVSRSIVSHSAEARISTAAEIQKAARTDLEKFGMTLSNLEITEAWSQPVEVRMTSGAN
jgi:hypothetical protein